MFDSFVITFSYGNYMCGIGGTDKYLKAEQKMLNSNHISMLHIFPVPVRKLGVGKERLPFWGMLVDGKTIGDSINYTWQVIEIIEKLISNKRLRAVQIHNFRWINICELREITVHLQTQYYFFIHDYLTICPYLYEHMEETNSFCNLSVDENIRCAGCIFNSQERRQNVKEIHQFLLQQSDLNVISPSEIAGRIWSKHFPELESKIKIVPHQICEGQYIDNRTEIRGNIKIAFAGYPSATKGWTDWMNATELADSKKLGYSFYHFGIAGEDCRHIKNIPVSIKDNKSSMIDELRKHEIDAVVLWSICPETYSYTFYEAFSANCFIITNEDSGNIAEQVKKHKNGLVLKRNELAELFLNERELREEINAFKKMNSFGPLFLKDNNEIAEMVSSGGPGKICISKTNNKPSTVQSLTKILYNIKIRMKELCNQQNTTKK